MSDDRIRLKVVLDVSDAGQALAASTALEELLEPPAHAVTRFQAGTAWRVEAYYTAAPDPAELAVGLGNMLGVAPPSLTVDEVPEENWVAISQAALPPVVAGRFTVHGSHDRPRIPRGPWSIEIDAGEAFGTAHHATTLGCLTAIDRLSRTRRFRRVLDLGCGSGVLAIGAARVSPAAFVTASDIDPEAVRVARENVERNRVSWVRVVEADGLPRQRRERAGRYDLVIANILADPLIWLAPAISKALDVGGTLVLSGLLTEQAPAVRAAYHSHGMTLLYEARIAGWSTLVAKRRR